MKKIYLMILFAVTFSYAKLLAQGDKTTAAISGFVSQKNDSMIGLMVNHNFDLSDHLMISTIGFAERFTPSKEGTVIQSYVGPAYRNNDATIMGGPYILGGVNVKCKDIKKTEFSYGAWVFLQTKNGSWTLWSVITKNGYFVEVWKCLGTFKENKPTKCEIQVGITNLKRNFGLSGRMNFPKQNLYAFATYTMKLYEGGGHEEEEVHMPKQRYAGLMVEFGYSLQYKKKSSDACEGCR